MIELILVLALLGLVAWLVVKLVPMPAPMQTVIVAVVVIFAILIIVRTFGLDVPIRAR